jgi:PilZ domain-containing protein
MSDRPLERRSRSRYGAGTATAVHVRIRPGHAAALVDVSAGGALIETSRRLLPDTCVEIYMESESRRAALRARVLRCAVVGVRPNAMHYRAAIQFDSYLPWFVEDDGIVVHESGVAGRTGRAAATPQVW